MSQDLSDATMSREQWDHLSRIKHEFARLVTRKYVAGVREHKTFLGDLSPIELIDNAIAEAIDQVTYLFTLREKVLACPIVESLAARVYKQSELLSKLACKPDAPTQEVPHDPGPDLDADTE